MESIQQSEEWDYSPTLIKEFMRAGLVDQVYMVDGEVDRTKMAEDAIREFDLDASPDAPVWTWAYEMWEWWNGLGI